MMGRNEIDTKNHDVATRIYELRKERGKEQTEVAKALGVSREILNHWESGTRQIKAVHLIKIAEYYNVTSDYLLGLSAHKTASMEESSICDYTGLSPEAVETLNFINSPPGNMSEQAKQFNRKTLIMINTLLSADNYRVWKASPFPDDNIPDTVFTEMYNYTHVHETDIKYIEFDDGTVPQSYNNRITFKAICMEQIKNILDKTIIKKPG